MDNLQRKEPPTQYSFKALFDPNKEYDYFGNAADHPFRFTSNKFQLVNAWWLAEASMLAYVKEKDFVRGCFSRSGFDKVKFFDIEKTQCFVAHNKDYIIVSFRRYRSERETGHSH